jgi:cytidylate kinase
MSKKELVVAFSGYPGTGKTELAEYLERTYGFALREGSTAIREDAARNGITLKGRQDYVDYNASRNKDGDTWLAEALLDTPEKRIILPGLRAVSHKNYLRQHYPLLHIGIICPPEVCIERIDKTDPKNPQTLDEYFEHMAMDNRDNPREQQVDVMLATADILVSNNKPLAECQRELDHIICLKLGGCAIL